MLGMKLPMSHFCFKTDHSCEKVTGIFIKVNKREATLTKENIFKKRKLQENFMALLVKRNLPLREAYLEFRGAFC